MLHWYFKVTIIFKKRKSAKEKKKKCSLKSGLHMNRKLILFSISLVKFSLM